MNRLTFIFLTIAAIVWNNSSSANTQVLVVGTIHNNHSSNPNYSYQDLVNILGTYNPDAICVEIPESYFRKRSYLTEMTLASMYGFEGSKKVYPIDHWWKSTARQERAEYMKTEEYAANEEKHAELVAADSVMQDFNSKYGDWANVWKENNGSYEFYNGKECNNFVSQMYVNSMAVYGDSPVNLYYKSRNNKMMELIASALAENKDKRVVTLTGCEHKHYFDAALSEIEGVDVVEFESILPLQTIKESDNIKDFLDLGIASGYYTSDDSSAIDMTYRTPLVPLLHGMGMDDDPSTISAESIDKAKVIIERWEEHSPNSVMLKFEKGWLEFLQEDYEKAAQTLGSISDRLDEVSESDQMFVTIFYHRNAGYCYDLSSQREKAILSYQKCKRACEEFEIDENYAKAVYKDYEEVPYCR